MKLIALFSALYLFASPATATTSIEIIHQNHLETSEGRRAFLVDELSPFIALAEQLNQEIQTLAEEIKPLSPQDDQPKIIALTEDMTQKMAKLLVIMPTLKLALSVDEDFLQIDAILDQASPLSVEQQQTLDRIASLCSSIESIHRVSS